MPLTPGTRLGPYEILASIGAGGMGEVYRARDNKLHRDVAVKVLPELFASDPDRLARFEREAQAIAALSHPNILAIHDFGSVGRTTYAVMELLEGETLRERMNAETLSVRKAVDYATQMARGLAAAHDKGIVHRDLKPENAFVTADGHLKILDFGLARHLGPKLGSADQTVSVGTEPGIVMGTVGYMSPEQVRGGAADQRSDIFSLGAVLYEMLTGFCPFRRETQAETMTAILKEDPPQLAGTGRQMPVAIERIVRHCLEKRPEERFQSARDLAFDLQQAESATVAAAPVSERVRSGRGALIAAAAAAFAVVGFLAGRWTGPATPIVSEWQGATFKPVTVSQQAEIWPALSPDGKLVAYASKASGNLDVYVQRIGGHNPTNLTSDSPDIDDQPAFSPDGTRIAFHSTREGGGIFVMGATGESVRRVSDFGYTPAWSPDGRYLAVSDTTFEVPQSRPGFGRLWVIAVEDGAKRQLPTGDAVQPAWSPDGTRLAYWGAVEGGRRDLWTIAGDGSSAPVRVTDDAAIDWSPIWAPDGRSLYFSSDRGGTMNVWRVAVDQRTGRVSGGPESVVVAAGSVGSIGLSRDGSTMLFGTPTFKTALMVAPFDRASSRSIGSPQVVVQGGAQEIDYMDLSPDGRWVAFGSADRQEDLFLVRNDGTGFRQLTDDLHRDRGPRWAPDGSRLAFYSNRQGPYNIWSIRPDGSRLEALADANDAAFLRPTWAPDGRRIVGRNSVLRDVFLLSLDAAAGSRIQSLPETKGTRLIPQTWSPDGRFIAGTVEDGAGSNTVYLFDLKSKPQAVHTAPAQVWEGSLVWLNDSRHLLFTTRGSGLILLDTVSRETKVLSTAPIGVEIPGVSIARDNRTIAFVELRMAGDLWLMERSRRD